MRPTAGSVPSRGAARTATIAGMALALTLTGVPVGSAAVSGGGCANPASPLKLANGTKVGEAGGCISGTRNGSQHTVHPDAYVKLTRVLANCSVVVKLYEFRGRVTEKKYGCPPADGRSRRYGPVSTGVGPGLYHSEVWVHSPYVLGWSRSPDVRITG